MIVELILAVWATVTEFVLGLLPSFTFPDTSGAVAAVQDVRVVQWVAWSNHFLPVALVATVLGLRFGLWAGMYAFEAVVWLLTKAHILGGAA